MSTAPPVILELVERFERNVMTYRSATYKEAQVRKEFIDPFFEALGWDVNNKRGIAEPYKDVIHEHSIKAGGSMKAPDYCFRIGPLAKFFVEAKKPAVNIRNHAPAAYQLRRYAWSAKLPLSILTDFEGFAVYDCRNKPDPADKVTKDRIMLLTWRDYVPRWAELESLFSRDAVWKGSFDRYALEKKRRGREEVGNAFLAEIERWRKVLAESLVQRNPELDEADLNFAVQMTIDRIVFLRICEDRNIEEYEQLAQAAKKRGVYKELLNLFYTADEKYNSGLFHFREEAGHHGSPDTLTPTLKLDDATLRGIIENLYYPISPYEFSVLPADILGHVYEQFLGRKVELDPSGKAEIVPKPEVRRAGGVYYTPTYVVRHIVKRTLGELLKDRTVRQAANLKILDPACGSGSFLLEAYQFLLTWHLNRYLEGDPSRKDRLYQCPMGEWRLTSDERKRILVASIFGVDMDAQAVEVTKLSLLLKVLEGESQESLKEQLELFKKRALPDLDSNIRCGNSLIESDAIQRGISAADLEALNVFDWADEFSPIMRRGGFDVVLGNPPYGAWYGPVEERYYQARYRTFAGVRDVYAFFIERALGLVKTTKGAEGRLSFIVPSAWLGGPEYEVLREVALGRQIDEIVKMPFDVFPDAYVDTAVIVLQNRRPAGDHQVRTFEYAPKARLTEISLEEPDYNLVPQRGWSSSSGRRMVLDPVAAQLGDRLRRDCPRRLEDLFESRRGVLLGKQCPRTLRKTSERSYPYFEGSVRRYQINYHMPTWVEFDDRIKERPAEAHWFEGKRILLRRLVSRQWRLMAVATDTDMMVKKDLYVLKPRTPGETSAVLGLLNSKLLSFLYTREITQATKDDFPQVTLTDLRDLPAPGRPNWKSYGKQLAQLTDALVGALHRLQAAKTAPPAEVARRQVRLGERQIDELVYRMYGLAADEVAAVERAYDPRLQQFQDEAEDDLAEE